MVQVVDANETQAVDSMPMRRRLSMPMSMAQVVDADETRVVDANAPDGGSKDDANETQAAQNRIRSYLCDQFQQEFYKGSCFQDDLTSTCLQAYGANEKTERNECLELQKACNSV